MKTYRLDLSEDEAETLGFALLEALRVLPSGNGDMRSRLRGVKEKLESAEGCEVKK